MRGLNLNEEQLRRLAIALAIALTLSVAWGYLSGALLIRSGDFPGFYAPAVIAYQGQWGRLYDAQLQQSIENHAWPEFNGHFYMSVYPPFVAFVLQPLGALSPQTARLVFLTLCLICFVAAVRLVPSLHVFRGSVFLLCFAPVFWGVLGGQNTAMSMLCLALCLHSLKDREKRHPRWCEFLAGIALGLWLFKPQFSLPMIGLVALLGLWRTVLGALVVGAVWYLIGLAEIGADWPSYWLEAVRDFSRQNYLANSASQVSLTGLAQALGAPETIVALAFLVSLAAFLYPALPKFRATPVARRVALAASALPLFSPQTLFYDLSLGGFALVWLWGKWDEKEQSLVAAYILVVLALCLARHSLAAAPMVVVSLSLVQFSLWRLRVSNAAL